MGRREVDDYFPTVLIPTIVAVSAFSGRGLLHSVTVNGVGGNGSVAIYEGANALGRDRFMLYCLENDSNNIVFDSPVLFELGCWIVPNGTAVAIVQVSMVPPDYTE